MSKSGIPTRASEEHIFEYKTDGKSEAGVQLEI